MARDRRAGTPGRVRARDAHQRVPVRTAVPAAPSPGAPARALGHGTPATPAPDHDAGTRSDLWERLLRLPRQQRAVIVLRYYEDFSDAEIAAGLGCRVGTVRAYASRALAALRLELRPRDLTPGPTGRRT
jgi:DNA-directed RNA polymerase specialized sigma24 family protein